MKLAPLVGAGILCLAVAAYAYEGPMASVVEAIQIYSDPDSLGLSLLIQEECGLDRESVREAVEGEFIRSRVTPEPVPWEDWEIYLSLAAACLPPPPNYLYMVTAYFSVFEDGAVWQLHTSYGVFGTSSTNDAIERVIVDRTSKALTDFIYSHDQR